MGVMTFTNYLKQTHTPAMIKRYLWELDRFFYSLQQRNIHPSQANYSQIMEYLGQLRSQPNNHLNVSLSVIKKYYSYLVATGQRADHPAKSIRLRDKKSKDIQLQDLFQPHELEQLMDYKERYPKLKIRNQVIISLLIYQGLTTGELKKITLEDLDLERGTLYIRATTRTNSRTLKLKPEQIMLLYNYIHQLRPKLLKIQTQCLLINQRGLPETGEGIQYLTKRARYLFPGRKLNPKTIRQSVITNLLKQGKDLRLVQAFAGHKRPSSTERYKQSQLEALKNQILQYHPLQ